MSDKVVASLPSRDLSLGASTRPRRRILGWPDGLSLLVVAVVAALLAVAEAQRLTAQPTLRLRADDRATAVLLDGFHQVERDGRGSYRWSSGGGRIALGPAGWGGPLALMVRLGPPPPQLAGRSFRLRYDEQLAVTLPLDARPRRYQVLVSRQATRFDGLTIDFQSETIATPADPRRLGLRFEELAVRAIGARLVWPAPAVILAQTALLLLGALLLRRLGAAPAALICAVPLLAIAVLIGAGDQALLFDRYLARLAAALGLLTALTYLLLPYIERRFSPLGRPRLARALWGVSILACSIRLIGALYPLFSGFDLGLNVDRLLQNLTGTLVITHRSIEFHNGITVYPPGPYLALMPGLLVGLTPQLLLQAGIALIDGLGAFAVGALARALGASGRAALLSALLYAAIPIGLTALWWGLTAQVFGQALMAPLALALLAAMRAPRRVGPWLAAGALLCVAFLSHIGVTIVALAWLGLAWLMLARRGAAPPLAWRRLTLALAISGAIGAALLYADVAALKVQQFAEISRGVLDEGYAPIYALIWRGFLIAFHPLGLLLLPAGLLLLLRRRLPPGAVALVGGWVATVLLFLLIEIGSGLQVRYIYFLTPLACILVGLLLDRLAARGGAARSIVWAIVVLLLVQGSSTWLTSAFNDLRMSMVSLLR